MTLRILWLSDRIYGGHSAYSKVTYESCTRLAEIGHKVAHIPMSRANLMGKHVHNGVLIYRSGLDPWGEDVAIHHYVDWRADMLITLKEPWAFQNIYKYAINFVPWAIIDHSPVSPSITSRLHTAFRFLVPSKFAQRELRGAGIENTVYAPHGVRTDLYKPLEGHKEDCKRQWFTDPDDFTVLMVTMNRSRKMNPRAFRGYKRFLELNPDVKSHLIFWGDMQPRPGGRATEGPIGLGVSDVGVNLMPEVIKLGLGEAITWPDRSMIMEGIPEWAGDDYRGGWDMVKLYNAADVLLFCTGGEGFGLPLIEAQACGIPVVTTDYAAAPELVGAGLTVRADDYVIINTPGVRRALTSIDGMAEALTRIMNSDGERLARRGRRFAERYSWENVVEKHYKPFLEDAEEELMPLITKAGVRTWA